MECVGGGGAGVVADRDCGLWIVWVPGRGAAVFACLDSIILLTVLLPCIPGMRGIRVWCVYCVRIMRVLYLGVFWYVVVSSRRLAGYTALCVLCR